MKYIQGIDGVSLFIPHDCDGVAQVYIAKNNVFDCIFISIDYKHEPRNKLPYGRNKLHIFLSDLKDFHSVKFRYTEFDQFSLNKLYIEADLNVTVSRCIFNIKFEDISDLPEDIQMMILMRLNELV